MSDALYPAMRWHPETGECIRVESVADDDPTYLDHHPSDEEKGGAPKVLTKQKLTKAEVLALLTGGQIEHDPKAKIEVLREKLAEGLRAAMTARGISYETGADVETLYAAMMAVS